MLSRNRIKYIQSLTRKKDREVHRSFIAETPKVVNEFLNSSYKIEFILAEEQWISSHPDAFGYGSVVEVVREDELKKVSQLKTPHGVLAVVRMPEQQNMPDLKNRVVLALDDLQDPGNLGTIVRIADWFGVQDVLCSLHTADVYNPKVVQASMGSLAHVRVHYLALDQFLQEAAVPVFATAMEGRSIYGQQGIEEGIIVIGNEGKGISDEIMAVAGERLSMPRFGKAESLNAAIATGIILSHVVKK